MTAELTCTCLDSWIISYLGQYLLTTLALSFPPTKISYFSKAVPGCISNLHWCAESWDWRLSLRQVIDLQPEAPEVKQEAEGLQSQS